MTLSNTLQTKTRMSSFCLDNMNSHNLCTHLQPPFGYKDLLGLGLKLCMLVDRPPRNAKPSIIRFTRGIQINFFLFRSNTDQENKQKEEYDPNIYIWSKRQPHPASPAIETSLHALEKELNKICKQKQIRWKGWRN